MLGVGFGRDDPRDLGQLAALHVFAELVEERAADRDVGAGASFLGQRAAVRRVLILVKVEQRVVAVVADVGIVAGPAPEVSGIEALALVLIDLPRNPGSLQSLGVGGPCVAALGVVDDRA